MSLASKIAVMQSNVRGVAKEGVNQHFGYAFFSEAQVSTLLRSELRSVNLGYITNVDWVTVERVRNSKGNEENLATARTSHAIVDPTSGASLTFHSFGQGIDSGDKAVPKAITMSCKYAAMKLLLISDNDDAEADATVDERFAHGQKPTAPAKPAAPEKEMAKPQAEAYDEEVANMRHKLHEWCSSNQIPEAFIVSKCKETMVCKEPTIDKYPHGVLKKLLTLQWQARLSELWDEVVAKGQADSYLPEKAEAQDEVPMDFPQEPAAPQPPEETASAGAEGLRVCHPSNPNAKKVIDWRKIVVHFGKHKGVKLGDLEQKSQKWFYEKWFPTTKAEGNKYDPSAQDWMLDAAVVRMGMELAENQ
jgi:hypothetical protein